MRDFLAASPVSREAWTTGIADLDGLLGGGVDAGRLWVITGAPSSGKSLLLTQFVFELGMRHQFDVDYFCSSVDPADLVRARLVSLAVGRGPSAGSLSVNFPAGDTKALAELEALRSSRITVHTGGGFVIEPIGGPRGSRRCLAVDDPEGKHPPVLAPEGRTALRAAADLGDVVIVTVPRSLCLERIPPLHPSEAWRGPQPVERLREEWAAVADLIVEVSAGPVATGRLTVLQNRWGPLGGVEVMYQPHRSRFISSPT